MKKIISLLLAVVMVCGLCAVAAAADDVTEVTLKVWAPQEDQANADSWLQQMEAKFEAAHPEYKMTWVNEVAGEDVAKDSVIKDPAAAADRLRRKRLQTRRKLQPSVVHPPEDRIRRRAGDQHAHQQPPRRPEQQTPRGNRTGERPQTPRTDLRREELLAGNPRGGKDLYRKTRNPDAQCLNVSPSTTSRWLCVS